MVEEFAARRRLGSLDVGELTARQVEGFAVLEKTLAEELKNGRGNNRPTA